MVRRTRHRRTRRRLRFVRRKTEGPHDGAPLPSRPAVDVDEPPPFQVRHDLARCSVTDRAAGMPSSLVPQAAGEFSEGEVEPLAVRVDDEQVRADVARRHGTEQCNLDGNTRLVATEFARGAHRGSTRPSRKSAAGYCQFALYDELLLCRIQGRRRLYDASPIE